MVGTSEQNGRYTNGKKITDWNLKGFRTRRRPKNKFRDELINNLSNVKLRNWSQIVKDRKSWNDLVQIKRHAGLVVSE